MCEMLEKCEKLWKVVKSSCFPVISEARTFRKSGFRTFQGEREYTKSREKWKTRKVVKFVENKYCIVFNTINFKARFSFLRTRFVGAVPLDLRHLWNFIRIVNAVTNDSEWNFFVLFDWVVWLSWSWLLRNVRNVQNVRKSCEKFLFSSYFARTNI